MQSESNDIESIGAFDQDLKALKKKHYDLYLLVEPVEAMMTGDWELLASKYDDHPLSGQWAGFREFHVEGDWLVVYFRDKNTVSLVLTRTGSHDELFGAKLSKKIIKSYRTTPRSIFKL